MMNAWTLAQSSDHILDHLISIQNYKGLLWVNSCTRCAWQMMQLNWHAQSQAAAWLCWKKSSSHLSPMFPNRWWEYCFCSKATYELISSYSFFPSQKPSNESYNESWATSVGIHYSRDQESCCFDIANYCNILMLVGKVMRAPTK